MNQFLLISREKDGQSDDKGQELYGLTSDVFIGLGQEKTRGVEFTMGGKGPSVEGLEGRRIVTTWDLLPRESVTFKPVSQSRASVKT